ncbi:MAG TPA: ROK family protein [Candidatus Paceibacterota bacterium]|nr:ROK family protein [Candidatus Paceibacterota bacterium]
MSRLVFDIGGTNLRVALASGGNVSRARTVPTPAPEAAIESLSAYVREEGAAIDSAAGGIAGIIRDGTVIDSPNLPAWNGFAFAAALTDALGVRTCIENDAALAALGEAREGAGKGQRLVGYMTVGTGVGGALVADGAIAPHAVGFEPGRQIIDIGEGRTLEQFVGGRALRAETGTPAEELPRAFYDERTPALATGVYDAIRLWSPDIFVLNGALMNDATGFRIADVARAVARLAGGAPMPPLVPARFGDASGLVGASLTDC